MFRKNYCNLINDHPIIRKQNLSEKKEYFSERHPSESSNKSRRRYYLGEKYPRTYLTLQEAKCAAYFVDGFGIKETAAALKLSKRTVFHYSDNIRMKLSSDSNIELSEILRATDFMNYLDELRLN